MWKIDAVELVTRLTRLEEQCGIRDRRIEEQANQIEALKKTCLTLTEKLDSIAQANKRDGKQKPAETLISEWLSGVEG